MNYGILWGILDCFQTENYEDDEEVLSILKKTIWYLIGQVPLHWEVTYAHVWGLTKSSQS